MVAALALQAAVAQSVQLAVPLAWELAPVYRVLQAVPPRGRTISGRSVGVDELLAVHLVRCELSAVRSFALQVDPLVVHWRRPCGRLLIRTCHGAIRWRSAGRLFGCAWRTIIVAGGRELARGCVFG